MPKNTVYFMTLSFSGHVDPMCGLVHEVAKNTDIDCVFYGIQEHKEKIEKTGARFRLYSHRNGADFVPGGLDDKERNKMAMNYLIKLMECTQVQIPAIMKDIEAEKPSLIVYDPAFIPARFLQEYLENKGSTIRFLLFYPNFAITEEMLEEVTSLMKVDLQFFVGFFRCFIKLENFY
jgi:UDP:flavonoid glycosyltransferase YjiC (YdhE family)